MDTHTYKLTTLCVELWITNYACTKNTLRLLQRLVVPFSRASMIQAPTHLEQQPSVQILSKIIITQQRSCSINKVCNRRNSGNFIENKFTPVAVYYWTCDSTHPISSRYHQLLACLSCRSFSALPIGDVAPSLELVIAVYSHENSVFITSTWDTAKNKMPVNNSSPPVLMTNSVLWL